MLFWSLLLLLLVCSLSGLNATKYLVLGDITCGIQCGLIWIARILEKSQIDIYGVIQLSQIVTRVGVSVGVGVLVVHIQCV